MTLYTEIGVSKWSRSCWAFLEARRPILLLQTVSSRLLAQFWYALSTARLLEERCRPIPVRVTAATTRRGTCEHCHKYTQIEMVPVAFAACCQLPSPATHPGAPLLLQVGKECYVCPSGSYCPEGIDFRRPCSSNAFSAIGSFLKTHCECKAGYYGVKGGACTPCEVSIYVPFLLTNLVRHAREPQLVAH